ncbi:hypothetical protein IC229_13490 [Spirosoma sp. BT702]|uniref:Uncharacterized protein n=1 Tax=Spirosoma profusum TaxID=2771354 RepID=A0A926Y188_9BACT|nr:hypothetical protein [Spirosoma profusum]MBD2701658.1 hypothetical protein [Spirosoma profusum]
MNRILFVLLLGLGSISRGQHQHHEPKTSPQKKVAKSKADSVSSMHHSMHHEIGEMMGENGAGARLNYGLTMDTSMGMTHSLSRYLPMNRNGSGTSWHPDNTPMYAYMNHSKQKGWSFMLHYAVFLRYTRQNGINPDKRGYGQQFGAPNWVMGMAQRKVGQRGLFQVRAMLSLDPLTVGNGGYPLLFQTGESYKGQPLIDKQHPHDFLSELSVSYNHAFSRDVDVYGYVGYPGEPALGPPAFMHRISAFNMPAAPLGHHWQDATHILFGVATVGFRYKWAKVEASSFTGREPDENRYNFDKPRFDSYSYRLSINPSPSLAVQFSQGFIKSPEDLHAHENVTRTTASVLHSKAVGPNRYVTSAFVWGRNSHDGEGENSFLAESSLQWNKLAVYSRFENVGKTPNELAIIDPGFGGIPANAALIINNITLGMNYRIAQAHNTDLVLGAQFTGSVPDKLLVSLYGKMPLSGEVYLRLTPSLMTMRSMHRMGHGRMEKM